MTKLYFHEATSILAGTLPSTVQSSLGTPNLLIDAATVNRSMDTAIGTSQTFKGGASPGINGLNKVYFTRFCSRPLAMTSIASDTWNFAFADQEGNAAQNFPCSGTAAVSVTVYVWRPSTGTKVGNILDGNSNADFAEPSATATEKSNFGSFAGSAIASCNVGDIICIEVYFAFTQTSTSTGTIRFYYDGGTETNNDNTTVSVHASYIETPAQTLNFLTSGKTVYVQWEEV